MNYFTKNIREPLIEGGDDKKFAYQRIGSSQLNVEHDKRVKNLDGKA